MCNCDDCDLRPLHSIGASTCDPCYMAYQDILQTSSGKSDGLDASGFGVLNMDVKRGKAGADDEEAVREAANDVPSEH